MKSENCNKFPSKHSPATIEFDLSNKTEQDEHLPLLINNDESVTP
jgi:hypothetical protein